MKLTHILEARTMTAAYPQGVDWLSQKAWDELSDDHKAFIVNFHQVLTGIRDDLIDSNQQWIDYNGPEAGEGWEVDEQAAETGGWEDLPDQVTDDTEWIYPILELVAQSVWAHDYDEKYWEENKDDDY